MSEIESHLTNFRQLNGKAPSWLRELREQAMSRFAEVGYPTTRMEDWKYTSVAALAKIPFRLAAPAAPSREATELARQAGFGIGPQLVFVNGRYLPGMSPRQDLPEGVRVGSLAEILAADPGALETHLARHADSAAQPFTALNTAFVDDGAVVLLAHGAIVTEPIHFIFISAPAAGEAIISHPRNLIVAGESSRATVVESYLGSAAGAYCTNAVTEVVVGANAHLAHYKVQREGGGAFHVATVEVRQAADSRFRSHAVSVGAELSRTDVNTVFTAEGGECAFDGLYLATGRQHVDHHTSIDHQKPHCTSRELYKGIMDGRSTGVFNGKVYVRPDAQKSDAAQVNKNLLLSEDAVVDTKPQLEIFADDVKCSHGATIGRLDEEAVFYLRSRGIAADDARSLLIFAFANELIERMEVGPVRDQLARVLASRFQPNNTAEASL